MHEPHAGQVCFRGRETLPVKARHERARADAQMARQPARGGEHGRESGDRLEERAHVAGRAGECRNDAGEDAGRHRRRGVTHEIAQPPPPRRLGAVHGGADAGGAQAQQRLRGITIVARHEGDGGNRRELAHEAGDRRQLFSTARMDRQDQRVDPLASCGPQRIAQRRGVECGEAAVCGGIDAGPLRRREDGAHGHHGSTTLTWRGRRRPTRGPGRAPRPPSRAAPPPPAVTGRYRGGSHAFARARRARGDALAGALILEMVGYRDPTPGAQIVPPLLGIDVPRTGDFLAAVGDARSRELLDRFVAAARPAVPELPLVPYSTRLRGWLLPLTRLSDNASFWDAGYASLMLTDTAFLRNPHYHQRSDTNATLDYEFMALVTEATAGAAVRLTDAT